MLFAIIASGHNGSCFGFESIDLFVKGGFSMRYIRRIIDGILKTPKFVEDEYFQPGDWSHVVITLLDVDVLQKAMHVFGGRIRVYKTTIMAEVNGVFVFLGVGTLRILQRAVKNPFVNFSFVFLSDFSKLLVNDVALNDMYGNIFHKFGVSLMSAGKPFCSIP